MNLFLDTSVMLAAAGSATGGSRVVFSLAESQRWKLQTSYYCLAETIRNLPKLPASEAASQVWEQRLFPTLSVIVDTWTSELPLVFPVPKDRPVLLSALASSDWLLTLDRADFIKWLGSSVYHLRIDTPAGFLKAMRDLGTI